MAANAQTTIDLIFNGIDKTGAATQSALANAGSLAGSLKNATAPIADFTMGAVKLEAGLLAAGVAMTVFAIKTAGDFDSSFRQITTLFDASVEDTEKFREAILKYKDTSAKPIEDIMTALSGAIGAGVDYKDSLDLLAVAEKLAVATRADLTGTTETLVSTLNAYGMKTEDAGKMADLFFQIIKDGKIEMTDLAASLANVTPLAAAAGVGMEEVGAAIATLTAAGVQPSQAIDGIRSALSNIIKPSEQAKKLAEELGIEFNIGALKSKGFAGVLEDVTKATGGSAEKMAILFGDVTGLSSVLTLTGPQATTFKTAIDSMGNSAGAVAEAFKKMTDSVDASQARISNAFEGLLIRIGTPLLNEFGDIAKAIAAVFSTLGDSVKDGALGELVKYIEGQMKSLQGVIETVAKNLPEALGKADLSGFTKGIDAVVQAFKTLFGNIDITTVDGLTRAIELAGAAFLGLSKFTEGVITSFKPLFDKLVDLASGVKGVDEGFFKAAGEIGGAVTQFNALLGGVSALIPWLEAVVALVVANQGMSLLGGMKALATAVPLAGAALQAAGVVMAAYWAADKVTDLVKALAGWYEASGKLKESQEASVKVNEMAGDAMKKFAESTGITVKSLDEMIDLHKNGTVVWDEATKSYKLAGEAVAGTGEAAEKIINPFEQANQAMLDAFDASEKAAGSTGKLAEAQRNAAASGYVPFFDAVTGALLGYEINTGKAADGTKKLDEANKGAAGSLSKISEETKKAEEAQRKWNEELVKMQFAEKLKMIEQQTAVMTASIEADAAKTVAAFESIAVGITSTGEVLGTLFGLYKDYNTMSWEVRRQVEEQIDKENKLRQDAFELQKKLTEAQIEQMKAQTDALLKGDGLIKIDGTGLKPHLEAFMWEILQEIQVKVNKDGLKMLLGA